MFPFTPRFSLYGEQPDTNVNSTFKNVMFPQQDDSNNASPAGVSDEESQPSSLVDVYRELLQRKDGPAMSQYKKFLSQGYPDLSNYKPGKLTKLGAIMSGMAAGFMNPAQGPEVTRSVMMAPYERALQRYELEGQRLEKGAALEETDQSKRLGLTKDISDAMYKQSEMSRQNRDTDSLIATRASEAAKNGQIVVPDKTTGHTLIKDRSGNLVADLGKTSDSIDEASQRKINDAIAISSGESPIIQKREAALEGQRNTDTLNREKNLGQFNFDLWNKKESTRQGNRMSLQDAKSRQQLVRDAQKAGLTNNNMTSTKLLANRTKVESMVEADPNRYSKFWTTGPNGINELGPAPDVKDPSYNDYVSLFNTLYNGLNALQPQGRRFTVSR